MKWLFVGLLLLTGCATPMVSMYTSSYPAKQEDEKIDIYRSQKPAREYIEIAEIKYHDYIFDDYSGQNMSQIVKKAKEIGADGVIILGSSGFTKYGEETGIKAIAIKYK